MVFTTIYIHEYSYTFCIHHIPALYAFYHNIGFRRSLLLYFHHNIGSMRFMRIMPQHLGCDRWSVFLTGESLSEVHIEETYVQVSMYLFTVKKAPMYKELQGTRSKALPESHRCISDHVLS